MYSRPAWLVPASGKRGTQAAVACIYGCAGTGEEMKNSCCNDNFAQISLEVKAANLV